MNERSRCVVSIGLLPTLLAMAGAGCSGPTLGVMATPGPTVSAGPYRIQAGDELEVRFFHTREHDVVLPVRPDGFISLPLVHELQVAGLTVEALRRELLARYQTELAEPELAVIVRTFSAYPVHIGGEVGAPGVLELRGAHNVLEAVLAAGGFLPSADLTAVLVVRRADPAGYELLEADLEAVLEGRGAAGNFDLRPYDVVFVPRSPIAEVNKWVDQYIRQNIPISFTYRLGSDY